MVAGKGRRGVRRACTLSCPCRRQVSTIVATQRPSADAVTGLIVKFNIENIIRIALSVAPGHRLARDYRPTGERLWAAATCCLLRGGRRAPAAIAPTADRLAVDFIRDQVGSRGDPLRWSRADRAARPRTTNEHALRCGGRGDCCCGLQLGSPPPACKRRLKVGYARAGRIMRDMLEVGVVVRPEGPSRARCLLDKDGLRSVGSRREVSGGEVCRVRVVQRDVASDGGCWASAT